MRFFFPLIFFAIAFTPTSLSAKPILTDYAALPEFSQAALSPDGSMVAFRKVDGSADYLVVYSLAKKKVLKQLGLTEINPQTIYFLSNNHVVIRVADTRYVVGTGEEYEFSAAYVLNIDTGNVEQLLRPGDRIYSRQTELGSLVGITKDKKHVFMSAFIDPKHVRSASSQVSSGPFFKALMKVELASPNGPTRERKGSKDTIDYFVDRNGEVRVEERYADVANEHSIWALAGKEWEKIYSEVADLRTKSFVGMAADGQSVVFSAYADGGRRQYYEMGLNNGEIKDLGLNRADADVEALLTDINRTVLGVRFAGFKPSYTFFDKKIEKRMSAILSKFSNNSVDLMDWSGDWKKLLIRVSGPSASGDYYLVDHKENFIFLGSERSNITAADINPITTITITAQDGLKIPTLITIPRSSVGDLKNLPMVMFPHGGPRAYDRIEFNWISQALSNEGYMVVQPQFRGSAGFGWDFIEAGDGEWGKKMQQDITDAVNFMVEKGIADKNRICIAGGSYGGYAALAGGAFTPELYRCIVSFNGVTDLPAFLANKKYDFGGYSEVITYFDEVIAKGGGKDTLEAISPVNFAENFQAPVLLIHGDHDRNVRIDQSKRMADSLKKAGKSYDFISLKDENHYIDRADSRENLLHKLIAFINLNLQSSSK